MVFKEIKSAESRLSETFISIDLKLWPGENVIKLFTSVICDFRDKLEFLYLASFTNLA